MGQDTLVPLFHQTVKMEDLSRQGRLFHNESISCDIDYNNRSFEISNESLLNWQKRIHTHQSQLFRKNGTILQQGSLFTKLDTDVIDLFDPLKLTPLPINFWRLPHSPHQGPAIYIVMDHLKEIDSHLILYLGETIAAEKRWKGAHDCKAYLSAYCEALRIAGISSRLSIRFWTDAPINTKKRRQLEQKLIQLWLPPFNKETRARWNTPFTADIN